MLEVDDKLLGVCSRTYKDRTFLTGLVEEFLGDYLNILPIDDLAPPPLEKAPKVILVSVQTKENIAKRFPMSLVLEAKRAITGYCLEEVIKLPTGKAVLVANNPERASIETIEGLGRLGIRHLQFIPYWPDCGIDVSPYDTAIYPGIKEYAPEHMAQYININSRTLTPETLMQVLLFYGLPFSLADKFMDRFTSIIVQGCYHINSNLGEMRNLKEKFERVCDSSTNVEVVIDKEGSIQAFNKKAEDFFDLSKERAIGTPYDQCLRDYGSLKTLLDQRADMRDELISVCGRHCMTSIGRMQIEGGSQALITIIPLRELQKVEAKARAGLHAKGFVARYGFRDIRGSSEALRSTVRMAKLYAETESTVLLSGESGTGKELFAQAIHCASVRHKAPFVGVNFAALPETLAESELFGYVEGAFTGAIRGGKMGLFEIAHGGTIFLDEIGDASPSIQSKLLRVLEEREVLRVGGTSVLPVNVRIISATNRNLENMVREGLFRQDLYYRIRVLPLRIPPLRERKEDIPFILRAWGVFDRIGDFLPADIIERLLHYDWPGNVRELKSVTEYLTIMEKHKDDPPMAARQILSDLLNQLVFYTVSASSLPQTEAPALAELTAPPPDKYDLEILRQLASLKQRNLPTGRNSLVTLKEVRELGLTVTNLRTRLKNLARAGYITMGRTRQGASLTAKATNLLAEVHATARPSGI